jgi:hypothetical protein
MWIILQLNDGCLNSLHSSEQVEGTIENFFIIADEDYRVQVKV